MRPVDIVVDPLKQFQKNFDKIANLEALSKSHKDDKHVPIDRDLAAKRIPFFSRDFSISDDTCDNFSFLFKLFPFLSF